MKKNGRPLVALDLGNSHVTALIAELDERDRVQLLGAGRAESKGFRKSIPVNLDAAVEATRHAIEAAEQTAGVEVDRAVIGVAGSHIRSFNSRGGTSLGVRSREVAAEDVHRAIEAARGVRLPPEQQLLHVLPQEYLLDNETGIQEPLGLLGKRLEVNVHLVTAGITPTQNLVSVANRTGLVVEDTVLSSLAAAEACLMPDEKEMGVLLIDIGGGSTNWIVIAGRAPRESGVVPVGGEHFTNDIGVGLRCPLWEAERIKRAYGCAAMRWAGQDTLFEVQSLGERPARVSSKRALCEIIEPRAEELADLLKHELDHAGYAELPSAGVVLTGGGAQLDGMLELLSHVFQVPVRLGLPKGIHGSNGVLASPACATAAGLLLHAGRVRRAQSLRQNGWWRKVKRVFGNGQGR